MNCPFDFFLAATRTIPEMEADVLERQREVRPFVLEFGRVFDLEYGCLFDLGFGCLFD